MQLANINGMPDLISIMKYQTDLILKANNRREDEKVNTG